MDLLWMEIYKESIRVSSDVNYDEACYSTDQQVDIRNRTRDYCRKPDNVKEAVEPIPIKSFRHKLRCKVYDRSAQFMANKCEQVDKKNGAHVYNRMPNVDKVVEETVPITCFKYTLRRKVYDRAAHVHANHGLEGRIVTSTESLMPAEQKMLTSFSLICRYLFCYHSNYAYIGKPEKSPIGPKLMSMRPLMDFFRHPALSPDLRISSFVFCGSDYEDLKAPPTVKKVKVLKNDVQRSVELIEASDYDVMLVMEDILPGSKTVSPAARIETNLSSPGYLRIKILDKSLVKKFPCLFDDRSECYYLSSLACDALNGTQAGDILEELNSKRTGWVRFSMDAERQGPARKNFVQLLIRESANETDTERYVPLEVDLVGAFPCLEWPSAATEWISRNRSSGWPNKELIEHILLAGCHIVGTSHCNSDWPEVEFRFSFSNPEVQLSKSLAFEQKQCYASFKGIIKHAIGVLEEELGKEVKLKSYHLKNVFLWACETIPREEWLQQHSWPKCFLFLIDQLLFCLEQRVMPGYFIPQCNLFDPIPAEIVDTLRAKILSVRQCPLTATIEFLKATVLYKDMSLELLFNSILQQHRDTSFTHNHSQLMALNCLQKLIIAFDSNSKSRFGKKAAIYDTFASWCRAQNNLSFSDCLCTKFSLFDIVYLDITYQANVAEDSLKDFAQREPSALVLSKLALCYREAVFGNVTAEIETRRDIYIRKALLLFEKSIAREQNCNALEFALFLYELERYEAAIQALELATKVISKAINESENAFEIRLIKIFVTEAIGRLMDDHKSCGDTSLPPKSFAYFLLVKCYFSLKDTEASLKVATEFEQYCSMLESTQGHLSFYLLGLAYDLLKKEDNVERCVRMALQSKLLSCGLQSTSQGKNSYPRCFHIDVIFALGFWVADIFSTDDGVQNYLDVMRRRLNEICFSGSHISKTTYFCFSLLMQSPCSHCIQFMASASPHFHTLILPIRWSAMHHIQTPSNKLYYAHLMMHLTVGESILPVLLEVIKAEKRHPISIIIWPKELRNIVDEYIRREVDDAEERGFIAIPTIVYAYYLLAKLHLRLEKTDEHAQTMGEFESLCLNMEDLSPISYRLLGYAYLQLAEHETLKDAHNQCIQQHAENVSYGGDQHTSIVHASTGSATALNVLQKRSFCMELTDQISNDILSGFTDEHYAYINEIIPFFEYGSDMNICSFCDAAN